MPDSNVSSVVKSGKLLAMTPVKKPVPSLKELCVLDKDVKEFLLLVQEEELREEALRLLNREITKKRPIVMGSQK